MTINISMNTVNSVMWYIMSARLKTPIKATDYNAAMKKARAKVGSQTDTSYTVDKVKHSSTRKGTKYWHIYVKWLIHIFYLF